MNQQAMDNFLKDAFTHIKPDELCDYRISGKKPVQYAPFQQRVIEERRQLVDKLDSLIAFMGMDIFKDLDEEERYRLILQRDAMTSYACILLDRIHAFKVV